VDKTLAVPRVVVVAASIAIVVLVLLVAFLVLRAALAPTDAVYVASNPHWGACTQAGEVVHCTAIATVSNQGGSRVVRVQYLAFYGPVGGGCDADIPMIDPGASRSLSCVVTMGSNFPPGTTGNQTPSDTPKAIVQP
jgi:hypothetical protein